MTTGRRVTEAECLVRFVEPGANRHAVAWIAAA